MRLNDDHDVTLLDAVLRKQVRKAGRAAQQVTLCQREIILFLLHQMNGRLVARITIRCLQLLKECGHQLRCHSQHDRCCIGAWQPEKRYARD